MHTCKKIYRDLPCAHRLFRHDGECRHIHGHNLAVELEFGAKKLTVDGFVADFGKMEFIEAWLAEQFDHTLLLEQGDPLLARLAAAGLAGDEAFQRVRVVPSAACERVAEFIFKNLAGLIKSRTRGRVALRSVTVHEDGKNSAQFVPA
jgi:6-pyruvoyltetrahydropterin/6-carboxytetrahydropterin synthase